MPNCVLWEELQDTHPPQSPFTRLNSGSQEVQFEGTPLHTLQFAAHANGCADPPAHTLPAEQPVVEHVAEVATHALDVGAVDAQPGEHEHAIACAPFPVQLWPTPQAMHVAVVPAHAVVVFEADEYPGLQLQMAGCDDPPAHTLPAEQPVVEHVDEVMTHALEVVAGEAKPGEHEHNAA